MDPNTQKPNKNKETDTNDLKQFKANSRYFTISVYALGVIFIGAIILKLFLSWEETVKTLKGILNITMPFLTGALIAFVLNPAVKKVSFVLGRFCHMKEGSPRKMLSIAITYILVLGMVVVVLFGIIPQVGASITDLVNYIPTAANQIYHFVDNLEEHFPELDMDIIRNAVNNAIPDFINYAKDFATNIVPALYQISMSIVKWMLNLAIAVIVSIYMLADKKPLQNSFKAFIYAFIPIKHISSIIEILRDANKLFSSFIIGKALDAAIIGFLCFLFMSLLRLPYAVLISVIVGITNIIPYFGPFIGTIPGVFILLLISPIKALVFAILILVLQQFDSLILEPKILGDSTGLRPLWIIIAITIGGSLAGVLGMFLGVPVVAFLRYLLNRILVYRLKRRGLLEVTETPLE